MVSVHGIAWFLSLSDIGLRNNAGTSFSIVTVMAKINKNLCNFFRDTSGVAWSACLQWSLMVTQYSFLSNCLLFVLKQREKEYFAEPQLFAIDLIKWVYAKKTEG